MVATQNDKIVLQFFYCTLLNIAKIKEPRKLVTLQNSRFFLKKIIY